MNTRTNIKREADASLFILVGRRTRTHLNASVRWTLAEPSAHTGFYLYFSFPLRERKMHIESCCPLLFVYPNKKNISLNEKQKQRHRSVVFAFIYSLPVYLFCTKYSQYLHYRNSQALPMFL